jgi:energy-converting hydrogenase Eha subunit G
VAYVAAWAPTGGVSGIGWAVIAFGFILDIASYSSRAAQQRIQPSAA